MLIPEIPLQVASAPPTATKNDPFSLSKLLGDANELDPAGVDYLYQFEILSSRGIGVESGPCDADFNG